MSMAELMAENQPQISVNQPCKVLYDDGSDGAKRARPIPDLCVI